MVSELLNSLPLGDNFATRVHACAQLFLSFSYSLDLSAKVPMVEPLHFPLRFLLVTLFHVFVIWRVFRCIFHFTLRFFCLPNGILVAECLKVHLCVCCKVLWVSTIAQCNVYIIRLTNSSLTTLKKKSISSNTWYYKHTVGFFSSWLVSLIYIHFGIFQVLKWLRNLFSCVVCIFLCVQTYVHGGERPTLDAFINCLSALLFCNRVPH